MRNLLLLSMLSAGLLSAESPAILTPPIPPPVRTLWKASLASLAVANVLDTHSSWGKHELNPALAGPNAQFGGQGALIKLGVQGGLMGLEYLITRGHPSKGMYRVLSEVNSGAAIYTAADAAHSYPLTKNHCF